MRDEVDVVVVGGGAAGIAAARRLQAVPGLTVLLIEAKDRLGGRAHTVALPGDALGAGAPAALGGIDAPMGGSGAPMDLGCAWLHSGLTNVWAHIADGTPGFTVDRSPAPWDDEERDLGLTPADREGYERALTDFHRRIEESASGGGDGALSDLVPAGSPWRGLLDAVSTYVSGAELDRVSVADSADYHPGEGDDWRVVEGYGTLVAHHGRDLPVAFGTVVRRIDHAGADVVRVETDRGTLTARAVLVTASTDVLARGGIAFHPRLPDKVEAAAGLPLGLADKLFLRVLKPELIPIEGYGLGSSSRGRTAAYHMRPFGRPYIECFYGGELARDLEREGMAAALAFARDELRGLLGGDAADAVAPICMTAWGQEPHVLGSYAYARPGAAGMRARLAEPVDGRLFFAGEACHASRFTTAHGAHETGAAAAEAILAALKPVISAAVGDDPFPPPPSS